MFSEAQANLKLLPQNAPFRWYINLTSSAKRFFLRIYIPLQQAVHV